MKIGFFTDTYLPVVHGVEISIETFRKSLEKMGHKVFIYAPHAPGYKDKNPNVFRFQSIRVIEKPEMRLAFPFLPKDHFGEIIDFKLDIAHAHTPFSMGLLAKYIADHQKIPLVYTHHTHYPEYAKFYLKEKVIAPPFG
jgi:1,2-diacylglycerol 3-alpha-glucosyltransferase